MENASKALIMAGAVLLSLMIIGISVFIFRYLNDPVSKAVNKMTSEERTFFNTKFQRYEGERVPGLETKALVNICLQNSDLQVSANERARIPEVSITFKNNTKITLTRDEIKTFNSEEFTKRFQSILNKINNISVFSVLTELNAKNGIVSKIIIEELNN